MSNSILQQKHFWQAEEFSSSSSVFFPNKHFEVLALHHAWNKGSSYETHQNYCDPQEQQTLCSTLDDSCVWLNFKPTIAWEDMQKKGDQPLLPMEYNSKGELTAQRDTSCETWLP